MLQGTCIDPDILPAGETFFLFPAGGNSFYASEFPRKGAHTGCFRKDLFEIMPEVKKEPEREEWPPYPPVKETGIELRQVYRARLMYHWEMCKDKIGKTFYVVARNGLSHVYYYSDPELKVLNGCLKAHWFENFELVDLEPVIEQAEMLSDQQEEAVIFDSPEKEMAFEQMTLF